MKLSSPQVFFEAPKPAVLSKEGWMGMDMHFHTEYSSDSIAGPQATLQYAKKLGLGLAVTDHNAIGGSLSLFKNRFGVKVIPGIELTGREGTHIIYYFFSPRELEQAFKKEIKPHLQNPFAASRPTLELLDRISRYNCVITAPHPFSPGVVGIKKLITSDSQVRKIHAVECINGYNLHVLNLKAVEWRARCKKSATGGTDGHMVEELGKVACFAQSSRIDDFLEEVRKRRTMVVGKEDPSLRKLVITLIKEQEMVSKSREYNVASKLLQSQYQSSHAYYTKKLSSFRRRVSRLFGHHTADGHKDDRKSAGKKDAHRLGGSWTRSEQLG